MRHAHIKFTFAGATLAVAIGLLAYSAVRDGWVYFLHVDQFVQAENYHGQRVRLHGVVGEENFHESRATLNARFELVGTTERVKVEYTGVIPEMFAVSRDVVVEGRLDDQNVFRADTLMTKCASKYESEDGQAPHADPRRMEVARD